MTDNVSISTVRSRRSRTAVLSVLAVRTHWYVLLPTFLWPEVIPTHTSHFPAVKLGPYSEFGISLPLIHFCLSDRQYFPTRPDASIWRYYRSEEHTSELQSQSNLVCRLLL